VSSEVGRPSVHFEPLRPASRGRLVAAFVLGPILWLVTLIAAVWVLDHSWAIAVGLLAAVASFLVSLLVLAIVHSRRRWQERRYADGG
jgi:hypothetical protein